LLAELHRNFNRQLDVAYIDIKSAFDSVDRVALWKALRVGDRLWTSNLPRCGTRHPGLLSLSLPRLNEYPA